MLTEAEIRSAKPRERDYKLYDQRGLYLSVVATGSKLWRFRYSYSGKHKLLALGRYDEVSLKKARDLADRARGLLAEGTDPGIRNNGEPVEGTPKVLRTFEAVAREWWVARRESERWDQGYALQVMRQFERDVFPIRVRQGLAVEGRQLNPLLRCPFGEWPIEVITPPDVLEICKNVEARGSLDAARDLRSRISMVYQRELALGRCSSNPAENVVALLAKPRRTNHATITYEQLPTFLARLDAEDLNPTTRLGLEALIATWLRSTELRLARWSWLDWKARELRIPPSSMKNGDKGKGDHLVPLSDYAIEVFRKLHAVTGRGELVFPSLKHRGEPISDGAWLNALYRMGYRDKATVHGIRALGSTTANEAHVTVPAVPVPVKMWETRWIDRQLDHVDGTVSGCYNRAEYLEPRRALMQWWGQKLCEARALANTLPPQQTESASVPA